MDLTVVVIVVFVVGGIAAWMFFGGEPKDTDAPSAPKTFRCKVCAKTFSSFLAAHEHGSADHELAGHKLDDSIQAE